MIPKLQLYWTMNSSNQHPVYIYRDLVPIPNVVWDEDDVDLNDSYAVEHLMLKRMVD